MVRSASSTVGAGVTQRASAEVGSSRCGRSLCSIPVRGAGAGAARLCKAGNIRSRSDVKGATRRRSAVATHRSSSMQHPRTPLTPHFGPSRARTAPRYAGRGERRTGSAVRRAIAGLTAALLWCSAGAAHADIYRYVDKDGVIHFSNVTKRGKLVERSTSSSVGSSSVTSSPVTSSPVSATANVGPSRPRVDREPSHYDAYIREAASLYQIPEALVRAVIRVESNFDPLAISRANARGLMQLIPATAERMLVTDPFDARQNVLGGTRYLRVLANLFNGNLQLTLAAYNAGEGAVLKYKGIPPYEETRAYVVKVMQFYNVYRGRV